MEKGKADEKAINQLFKNVKRKLVEPIIAPARRRRQARIDQKKELDILFGEQDAIDVLSYAGLEENVDYLNIDGEYVRTLYLASYPFVAVRLARQPH